MSKTPFIIRPLRLSWRFRGINWVRIRPCSPRTTLTPVWTRPMYPTAPTAPETVWRVQEEPAPTSRAATAGLTGQWGTSGRSTDPWPVTFTRWIFCQMLHRCIDYSSDAWFMLKMRSFVWRVTPQVSVVNLTLKIILYCDLERTQNLSDGLSMEEHSRHMRQKSHFCKL